MFVLSLTTDDYATETSWDITDPGGNVVEDSGSDYRNSSEIIWKKCFPEGQEFIFTLYDSYGDGICCDYGEGSYTISYDGVQLLESDGEFGESETTIFGN
jgi:hypothetical protein